MDSDNNATPSPSAAEASRRSGRVKRAPQRFSSEAHSSQTEQATSKRKRDAENDENGENGASEADQESELSELDDETADEEPAPRPKKSRSRARKPAMKRAKVNGTEPAEENAPEMNAQAVSLPNRPKKKTARIAVAQRDGDGVYAEIFGSGDSSDDVASHWFQRYQANNAKALTDLVNCVLLAAGCEQKVTEDDIRDPDNITNRLLELQEAYEQTNISDYPLISKAKSTKNFRDLLVGFFESLISLLHLTDVLYNDANLLENVTHWIGSMSDSSLRPFRHTASTVGLSMLTAMISVTKQLDDRITKSSQAIQAESNRRGKNNQNLVANTQQALDAATQNRQYIDEKVKEIFDIVFVHRYRDIDERIRADCIEALGTWICTLPTVYMAPEYLRYLGWLLSDVSLTTRQEVLKQLGRVLKRDAEKLAHFIDRFRPRLVEMATSDRETSVRVLAIYVVDILRSSGMLEPEEVDSICKLLFDTEVRIRRAVVPFFAELVQEFIDNKIDEIGGNEALDEIFGDEEEEEYNSLRKDWINIKALAENLAVYNKQLDEEQDEIKHGLDVAADVVNANIPETRIALATQVLYEKMPEISNWQVLAGYLLFDHTISSKSKSKSKANSVEAATRKAVAPNPEEEVILLEVLATAVKESLMQSGEHEKSKRKVARLDLDSHEDAGMQLATIIPQLLNKFGSDPHVAGVILRLEHYVDLDVFQQLRQNSATYDKLLDEITRQFNRHVDQTVLKEAAIAFIHARQYEELEELTDSKLSVLWGNSINSLRKFEQNCELTVRGNLGWAQLSELANILKKMSKLASVSDCVDILEAPLANEDAVIKFMAGIVHRGLLIESDDDLDDPEDEVVGFAIKICQFYFMWKMNSLKTIIQNEETISDAEVDQLVILRKEYVTNLIHTLSSRGSHDDLRLMATGSLCDCCNLFVFLRPSVHGPQAAKYGKLRPLLEEMPSRLITDEIIPIFNAAEREYAKRAKKGRLNEAKDDEEPDSDDEPPEDDEEEELTDREREAAELKAEKILTELTAKLVLAILGKMIDHSGPNAGRLRKRLLRNKAKLGPNFKEVVLFLDKSHLRELKGGKKKPAFKGKGKDVAVKKPAKSVELVIDSDNEDDPFAEDEHEYEPEEGTVEDLRNRELLEDPIEDQEVEEQPVNDAMDDDSVIGD